MGLIKRTVKRTVRQKIKRPARRAVKHAASKATVECPACHKRYTNPLTHTCTVKTDYKKRVAAEKRRQATEARRAKAAQKRAAAKARRKAAADRRKAAAAERRRKARARPAPRQRSPQHDYRLCRDDECRRHACVAFKEGFETGIENCPLPHGDG